MKSFIAGIMLTAATAAGAQEKLTTYTNSRHNDRVYTGSGFIYDHPKITVSAEEQTQGTNLDIGYAVQLRQGPFSVQIDGDTKNNAEAKLIATKDTFLFLAGGAHLEQQDNIDGDNTAYAGATWSLRKLQDNNNIGAGFVYGDTKRRESGYVFGRMSGVFAGHNWAHDGKRKFVISRPSEKGPSARWLGIRDEGFSYDQINFSLNAEVMGGIDSVRAMQDQITSPSESLAATNINPLRFVARADQRGSGLNIQLSRTKSRKASYAAEVDAYLKGNFWLGANYDNSNGDTYGIAAGQTEHPRLGPGRVPFSVRGDFRYNTRTHKPSFGLHVAKRWIREK